MIGYSDFMVCNMRASASVCVCGGGGGAANIFRKTINTRSLLIERQICGWGYLNDAYFYNHEQGREHVIKYSEALPPLPDDSPLNSQTYSSKRHIWKFQLNNAI